MSIELVNVSKAFGETQVLRGLSERFAQGEAVCVMGRSGLGKTTLASIVMGLEKPDAGAVRGAKENALQPPFRRTGWWSAFPRRGTCGLPAVRRWMSRAWRRLSRLWA
ncbi:MAG: ATP-binding cassette domain-containing protein [Ruthenibacterium lactatiformans]